MAIRVAVLMGGWSAEREVSLSSGKGVVAALRERGYDVDVIDVAEPDPAPLLAALQSSKPDVVFNALHGRGGEDGTIQALLNMLAIPYTHSGLTASAVAMDKPMARAVFAAAGLPVAEGCVVARDDLMIGHPLPPPYVVKPPNEGSSVGVFIVHGQDRDSLRFETLPETVLVESFIPGRELTVAVMGDRALDVLEIRPRGGWYDYTSKYAAGGSEHLCPAPIHAEAYAQARQIALAAHQALGCRGISRADLRYDDTSGEPGRLVLLEVNTQPGMTPTSLVPDIAAAQGISYADLVCWLVEAARCDA